MAAAPPTELGVGEDPASKQLTTLSQSVRAAQGEARSQEIGEKRKRVRDSFAPGSPAHPQRLGYGNDGRRLVGDHE